MSKGANFFNHFSPKKNDGHFVKSRSIDYVQVWCPKIKDLAGGTYTSNGIKCSHCGKTV